MVLMLRPRSGQGQWVRSERYDVEPHLPLTEYTDLYGNLCQRLTSQAGSLAIETISEVEVADVADSAPGQAATPVDALSSDMLHFLLPSRYCESDKLVAQAEEIVAGCAPGFDQAERIRAWVHDNVQYV